MAPSGAIERTSLPRMGFIIGEAGKTVGAGTVTSVRG
jgi:hypothetical protein